MTTNSIKTYNTETFREAFMQSEPKLAAILKPDFGRFFVVRVEDMIRLMKLPVPPTRSTAHILIFLTEGEAIMTIGSETYRIVQHECLVVPAGQVFAFNNVDLNQGYLCVFHHDFIIGKFGKADLLNEFEFLEVWGNPRIELGAQPSEFVANLFKRVLIEYSANGLHNLDIIQPYFIALLCEINQVYKPVSTSAQANAILITNRFKALLFKHFRTHHLVSDYASLLAITPNHLNKVVKAITNKSPTTWIDEAIVLEAKVLLSQSTMTVGEVAAEIGLFDASYFSRMFKKYEGMTPLAFRKMIEKS